MLHNKYRGLLEQNCSFIFDYLYSPEPNSDIACFGMGDHGHWSMQTNTNMFAALATLAADPDTNHQLAGYSKDEMLATALKLLRFTTKSHMGADSSCFDNQQWGCSWISSLCIDRMFHGIEAVTPFLTQEDNDLIDLMLVTEANWLSDEYKIVADEYNSSGKNHPESNMWNASIIFRTLMRNPDIPRSQEYLDKAYDYLLHAISISSDKFSEELFYGKPVKDQFRGANFFDSYSLDHHGYLNVGYMVITLSNLAILHFSYKNSGIEAPTELYRHAYDLWALIKKCTFEDGRLLRIGGDTRARYCYCQDYAIPMWLMMLDKFGETDCIQLEDGWLNQVQKEVNANAGNSFLENRLEVMKQKSMLYYHRLEGDRFSSLSMGTYWRRIYDNFVDVKENNNQTPFDGNWNEDFHGAMVEKGENRTASWVWHSGQKPTGICVPRESSDMAEWEKNFMPVIKSLGKFNHNVVQDFNYKIFNGGFHTVGHCKARTEAQPCEGASDEDLADIFSACIALPDDKSVLYIHRAEMIGRFYITEIKDFCFKMPNDVFNNNERKYITANKTLTLKGYDSQKGQIELTNWLNIDDKISVVSLLPNKNLIINRPGERQISIKSHAKKDLFALKGTLFADEIMTCFNTETQVLPKGEEIVQSAILVRTEDANGTKDFVNSAKTNVVFQPDGLVDIEIKDGDNCFKAKVNLSLNKIDDIEPLTLQINKQETSWQI
ncbi:MAG: hypothetical protein PF692_05035 [Kiritimatiellae bacterium]|jgi:hypothetical protein|nr:hypothetical protein [Kiritimatiellia bacterium]